MLIPSRPSNRAEGAPLWAAAIVLLLCALAVPAAAQTPPADSLAAPPVAVRHWQTQALRPDRIHHASLALAIGVGSGIVVRSPAAGAGVALGLGVAKELADVRFDRGDLAADAVGAVLAAILVAALTR